MLEGLCFGLFGRGMILLGFGLNWAAKSYGAVAGFGKGHAVR